jgi:serine protease Do
MTRGSIGIEFPPEEKPALLSVYGAEHGIFVQKVRPDSPAEKAGLKAEDILTSINGKPLNKGQDLIDVVAGSPVGSTLKFGVIRDKKPMTIDIVVADRNKLFTDAVGGNAPEESESRPESSKLKFGMSVQTLRPTDSQSLGFKGGGGVLVTSTDPLSFADNIGLAKGDIIVQMNRQKVASTEDIRRIEATLKPGQPVAFQVMRQAQGPRGGGGEWQSFFAAGTVPPAAN